MSPKRLVQAVLLVVGSGVAFGDQGALIALVAVAAAVGLALVWSLPAVSTPRLVADGEIDRRTGFPGSTSLYAGIVVAAASDRNADLSLVPALRRIVAAQVVESGGSAVRGQLGEHWWGLLDPQRSISSNSSSGGISSDALEDLLSRLEAHPA